MKLVNKLKMEKNTINSHQLLLLCALRAGQPVVAKNLEVHKWTYYHYNELIRVNLTELTEGSKQKIIENISEKFPVMEIKERNFIAHELHDLGQWTLSDHDEDMSWYQPNGTPIIKSWKYEGLFELKKPLTEKEQYFLKQYAS